MLKRNAPSRQGRAKFVLRSSLTTSFHDEECTSTANSKRPRTAAAKTSTAVVRRGPSRPTGLPRQLIPAAEEAIPEASCTGNLSLSTCTARTNNGNIDPSAQAKVETACKGTKANATDLAELSQPEHKQGENEMEVGESRKKRSSVQLDIKESGNKSKPHEASGIASRTPTTHKRVSKVKKDVESKRVRGWVSGSADVGTLNDENQERHAKTPPNVDIPHTPIASMEVFESAAKREKESIEREASADDSNDVEDADSDIAIKQQSRRSPGISRLGPAAQTAPTTGVNALISPPPEKVVIPDTSSTAVASALDGTDLQAGRGRENLPPSPFLGHENVSWTCLACDGASHHLTSRSAMEPLRRVHGFKVHRVPNDGDCFFSSVKAAVEGSVDASREGCTEDLTVAQMREWVADETGEEQLDFYILQAKANPQDRWLDFVRPMDERLPSDDEDIVNGGDEDEGDEDEVNGVEDDRNSSRNTPPAAQKQPKRRGRERETVAGGESNRNGTEEKAAEAPESRTEDSEGRNSGARVKGLVERNRGFKRGGVVGWEALAFKTAIERPPPPEHEKSPAHAPVTSCETSRTETPREPVVNRRRFGVRRSTRTGRSGVAPSRGDQANRDEGGARGGKGSGPLGLPVVRSVEELRRFVRLEGSVVGHGGCMWADTFAHHVVSRRLGITILFVDMERDKRAWPYRVLAKCADKEGSEDERFVLLKREPNHFVLIKMVVPAPAAGAQDDESASTARNCPNPPKRGLSCFRRSELPDVVRKLWRIDQALSMATRPAV